MSSTYRTNITGILNKWNSSMADQKDRLKKRLTEIHNRRYNKKQK